MADLNISTCALSFLPPSRVPSDSHNGRTHAEGASGRGHCAAQDAPLQTDGRGEGEESGRPLGISVRLGGCLKEFGSLQIFHAKFRALHKKLPRRTMSHLPPHTVTNHVGSEKLAIPSSAALFSIKMLELFVSVLLLHSLEVTSGIRRIMICNQICPSSAFSKRHKFELILLHTIRVA